MLQSILIDQLEAELPPIIVRARIDKLTGGLVSPKTLSNADTLGLGPKEKEKVANKIVYSRKAFIEWIREHCKPETLSSIRR